MEDKRLQKNQYVLFENGHKAGYLEAVYSHKYNAFAYVSDEEDENGNRIVYYSNNIIDKPVRNKKQFIPSKEKCTVQIFPCGETEKAYQLYDGSDGKTRHSKNFYKYIAKSICYIDENGNIFAPVFAIK